MTERNVEPPDGGRVGVVMILHDGPHVPGCICPKCLAERVATVTGRTLTENGTDPRVLACYAEEIGKFAALLRQVEGFVEGHNVPFLRDMLRKSCPVGYARRLWERLSYALDYCSSRGRRFDDRDPAFMEEVGAAVDAKFSK